MASTEGDIMRNGFRLGVCAFALLMLTAGSAPRPALAQSTTLFVRKAELQSVVRAGKLYAPAADLLRAMGLQWTVDGTTVRLSAGKAGGAALSAKATSFTFAFPSGKVLTSEVVAIKGEAWVPVRSLAEMAGGTYVAAPGAGIVQVVLTNSAISQKDLDRAVRDSKSQPGVSAPSLVPTGSGSTSGKGDAADSKAEGGAKTADAGAKKSDGSAEDEKDPIEVVSVDYMNPIIPGSKVPAEVRG